MTMAATVKRYLDQQHVHYDLMTHPRTGNSMRTAAVANVPAHRLAKAVILEDDDGLLMAVLPANRWVRLGELRRQLGRNVALTTEKALASRFPDCAVGAIPPMGAAYQMRTIVDDELENEPEVYLEAGDHQALMRMDHDGFMQVMSGSMHGSFAGARLQR